MLGRNLKVLSIFAVILMFVEQIFGEVYEATDSDEVNFFLSDDPKANIALMFYDEVQEVTSKDISASVDEILGVFLPEGEEGFTDEEWVKSLAGNFSLMRVDSFGKENKEIVAEYGIISTPYLVILENGTVVLNETVDDSTIDDVEEILVGKAAAMNETEPASNETDASAPNATDSSDANATDAASPNATDSSPPAANDTTPPAANDTTPPAANDTTPPAANETTPPAANDTTPPAANDTTPPAANDTSAPNATEAPAANDTNTTEPTPGRFSDEKQEIADAEAKLLLALKISDEVENNLKFATASLEDAKKDMVEASRAEQAAEDAEAAKKAADEALQAYKEAVEKVAEKIRELEEENANDDDEEEIQSIKDKLDGKEPLSSSDSPSSSSPSSSPSTPSSSKPSSPSSSSPTPTRKSPQSLSNSYPYYVRRGTYSPYRTVRFQH